jgi:arylsulfatase A-like enzyme
MKIKLRLITILLFYTFAREGFSQTQPNIVLIFPDNIGMGEVSAFGGVRGVATPNIDRIGQEGMRLTNFNVEYSCTPSRIAILTGRYAARAGEDYYAGTTLWEKTLAEQLKSVGYATVLFGKWDIGGEKWLGKREPTHQGFDEWYGIPATSHYAQFTSMKGFPKDAEVPYIWEGVAGQTSKKVKPFDLETRRTIDREAAEKSVDFIKRSVQKKKPFFLYYPMTQLHFPALPHPDKVGTTGAGDMGDAMADVDHNVGLIMKELAALGIDKNTIVIWCSDNGAELRRPWRGTSGQWRGYYNSAMEGGVRTPCVIRWPSKIKAGQVSNEMVHEVDLYATLSAAAGVTYQFDDRIIDGVNQLPFLEGKQKTSNRSSAIFMNRNGAVMAVKWHHWKLWYNFKTEEPDPDPDNIIRLFDLRVDPQEAIDVKDHYPWVIGMMDSIVKEYEMSLVKFPRVALSANVADPYIPYAIGSGKWISTYSRSDKEVLGKRSPALPNPDFTGSWSTIELSNVSVINRSDKPKPPSLGSGWGDKISIVQRDKSLDVERVIFTPREYQPMVNYHYALDGTQTENKIELGRGNKPNVSTTKWDGDRLIITTMVPYQNPLNGVWSQSKLEQTIWLEASANMPWEPKLVVETYRESIPGGISSINRTVYSKGYR